MHLRRSTRSSHRHGPGSSNGEAEVCADARNALGQALDGAYIVASSKPVVDDKDDPPCIGAKREYEDILEGVDGEFVNTAEHVVGDNAVPMVFEVTSSGPVLQAAGSTLGEVASKGFSAAALAARAKVANDRAPVVKQGPQRFA